MAIELFGDPEEILKLGPLKDAKKNFREEFQRQLHPGPQRFNTLFGRSKRVLRDRFGSALSPGLSSAAALEASKRGGILPAGTVPGSVDSLSLTAALDLTNRLSGLRNLGSQIEQGLPPKVNQQARIVEGGAEGFVAGGPIGAGAGAIGGRLGGKEDKNARDDLVKRVRQIFEATEPGRFGETLDETAASTREAALASGAGARAEQSVQRTISLSGLRGTPLGSLASIAAGAQEDLLALGSNFQTALGITEGAVRSAAGAPIQTGRDPLARALEGIANAALAFNQGRRPKEEFQGPEINPRTGTRVPGAGPEGTARVVPTPGQTLPGA